jgi:hypothetical protein
MKVTNVFPITIFRAGLQPYFILTIVGMARDTLIKHKEIRVIYEENGLVIANYNALITQPESKLVTLPKIIYTTTK